MNRLIHRHAVGIFAALLTLMGSGTHAAVAQGTGIPDYQAIVASPDRSEGDRQADQRRQPGKMLAFAGVQRGMKVLDMEASAGYSTELLARTVAPDGVV